MQHHTDSLIESFQADAAREVADWPDAAECAVHFVALYRLASEHPEDFADRLAFLGGRAPSIETRNRTAAAAEARPFPNTYQGRSCIRGHDGERFLSSGACVHCSRDYKVNARKEGRAREVPAAVRKARRIEKYVRYEM